MERWTTQLINLTDLLLQRLKSLDSKPNPLESPLIEDATILATKLAMLMQEVERVRMQKITANLLMDIANQTKTKD